SEDSVYTARPDEPRFRRTALDRAATRLRIVGVASAGARILLFFERDGGRTFATLFVDPESGAAQDGPDLPPPVERHGEQELHVARLRDGRALVAQAWTIHSWDRADLPQNIVGCAVAVFSVGGAGVFAFVGKRSVSGLVVGLLVGGAVAGALLAALFSVFSGSFAR
ncbi:MAG TPA: hypothetical protein VIF62_37060, partial [Labilithrix sp.]